MKKWKGFESTFKNYKKKYPETNLLAIEIIAEKLEKEYNLKKGTIKNCKSLKNRR